MNILDIISGFRDEDDDDLLIQCDVFYDEKLCDDEALAEAHPGGVDIDNHQDVFNAVFKQVRIVQWTNTGISRIVTIYIV